ncbi:MAG: phosphoglycerate kinase [Hyphomonadaceae bacterium]|nr:phosphoglycerate kinase [Hyphomonadaceae bacterium]GIK47341.1 MAG: phosphoglycerate kinase [Alphaproteobacteria bacterium]
MSFRRIEDAPSNKTALVRVDFNVPMADGAVSDDTRLRAALPTIEALRAKGCKIALLAHFDRPKGKRVPEMSLAPVAPALAKLLDAPVAFADDCVGDAAKAAIEALPAGGVILLENTRFHAGEEKNDPELAGEIAALGDFYVNDAFSAAHRAHASTEGLAHVLTAYAGKQMERELDALNSALGDPKRPVLGIVGGAKVSTKLDLLQNLIDKLDRLAIGGGMANTFLYAQGVEIGGSLAEKDMADTARAILAAAKGKCEILLPVDVVVAKEVKPHAEARMTGLNDIGADEKILDAGEETVRKLRDAMKRSRTLIWNGPLGVFETPPFDQATVIAAQEAAELAKAGKLIAVAGGGDTVAALNHAGVADDMTFVSTAGGAFLEWMEGKALPGVEALKR